MNPRSSFACWCRFVLGWCSLLPATVFLSGADSIPRDVWPRTVSTNGTRIEVFQPQLESWQTNLLRARAVVEVTFPSDNRPHLGVVWFTAATQVDKASRQVTLDKFNISRTRFSVVAQEEAGMQAGGNLPTVVAAALPQGVKTIALDRLLLASLMAQSQARRSNTPLKHDPPLIIWTTNAVAALVLIDGNPVLRPVPNSALLRVINTSSLILFDPSGGTYYLSGNGAWFQSEGINGPWSVSSNPPAGVRALTPSAGKVSASGGAADSPVVFVSTQPAELLHTLGEPVYKSEEGSGMMYLANSDSQVLYNPLGGSVYLLLSGRWFTASSLTGPWTYVAPKNLPQQFSQIEPHGPKGVMLASVPGTPQATAARVANSLPQTATIARAGANYVVYYDGAPQFQPIQGTGLQYAINAAAPVILCQGRYYAVGNAVWFTADAAAGPWSVATSVPPEIYSIPPSSPLYYVTFVYVGYADDEQVESAYLPGYTGSYEDCDDCGVVYGTGWYYTPWADRYYYGWGWPYGYSYQYRWWDRSWLWRPAWNRIGNFYAINRGSVYDTWPRSTARAGALEAREDGNFDRGYGYPATYGRFAGAIRPVPMAVPARAALVDPYATLPMARSAALGGKGAAGLAGSLKVGSTASRDLYASTTGDLYWRRDGNWYRANADGGWGYVAPAIGPNTHAYHPATVANYQLPSWYRSPPAVAAPVAAAPVSDARAVAPRELDQDFHARAAGESTYQQWHPYYRGRR